MCPSFCVFVCYSVHLCLSVCVHSSTVIVHLCVHLLLISSSVCVPLSIVIMLPVSSAVDQ